MKFKQHTAGKGGWSEWVNPKAKGYKFACCDCGLVHDMDFKVVRFERRPSTRYAVVHSETLAPIFRARRNARSTAAMRRTKALSASRLSPADSRSDNPEGHHPEGSKEQHP